MGSRCLLVVLLIALVHDGFPARATTWADDPLERRPTQAAPSAKPVGQLGEDQKWIVLASRESLPDAVEFARRISGVRADVRIFRSVNNWYTIVLGPIASHSAPPLKDDLVRQGSIPTDAYVAGGRRFVEDVTQSARSPVAIELNPPAPFKPNPVATSSKQLPAVSQNYRTENDSSAPPQPTTSPPAPVAPAPHSTTQILKESSSTTTSAALEFLRAHAKCKPTPQVTEGARAIAFRSSDVESVGDERTVAFSSFTYESLTNKSTGVTFLTSFTQVDYRANASMLCALIFATRIWLRGSLERFLPSLKRMEESLRRFEVWKAYLQDWQISARQGW
jgi:hypothetical protein